MRLTSRSIVFALICLGVPTLVAGAGSALDAHVRQLAQRCDASRSFNADTWICEEPAMVTPAAVQFWAGKITKIEVSTFMYGSHLLEGSALDGNPKMVGRTRAFALRSPSINLDAWTGKPVIITGTLVPGYPVDGGPPFIAVTAVEFDQVVKIQ